MNTIDRRSLFSQTSSIGMSSGNPYAMAAGAALGLYGPIIDKKINNQPLTPFEGAAFGGLTWGPLGPIGAYKGYMDAKKIQDEQEANQKRITGEYQNWMQREAKPYDTEGFYQIPQMAMGGKVRAKYGGGGQVIKSPTVFKPTLELSTEYFPESKRHKETFEFQPGDGDLNFLKRRDLMSFKMPVFQDFVKNIGLPKGSSINVLGDIGLDTNENSKLSYRNPGSNDPRNQQFSPAIKKNPFFSAGLQYQYLNKDLKSRYFKPYADANISFRLNKNADGVHPRYNIGSEIGAAKNNMDLYFEMEGSAGNSELSKGTYYNYGVGARYRKNGISAGVSGGYNGVGEGAYLKGTLAKSFNFKKKDMKEEFSNLKDYFTPVYKTRETYRNTRYLADGGEVETQPIEVEGNETFEYPNGKMEGIKGPTHEEGGIPMQAKEGSRVYSNRIQARQDIIDRLKKY